MEASLELALGLQRHRPHFPLQPFHRRPGPFLMFFYIDFYMAGTKACDVFFTAQHRRRPLFLDLIEHIVFGELSWASPDGLDAVRRQPRKAASVQLLDDWRGACLLQVALHTREVAADRPAARTCLDTLLVMVYVKEPSSPSSSSSSSSSAPHLHAHLLGPVILRTLHSICTHLHTMLPWRGPIPRRLLVDPSRTSWFRAPLLSPSHVRVRPLPALSWRVR